MAAYAAPVPEVCRVFAVDLGTPKNRMPLLLAVAAFAE